MFFLQLVASLDALLEKSPSADLGRAAVNGFNTGPSPRSSVSLAPEPSLRRSGSSSSIANEVLALLEKQPSRASLSRAVSFKDVAASPSLSAEASVASLLDQISTVTSPRGSFAAPPAALSSPPVVLPEASFGPAVTAAAAATSPGQVASDASQQLRRSPSLSGQAVLDVQQLQLQQQQQQQQQRLLRSPSLTPPSAGQAATRASPPLSRAPSGIPAAAGTPPSPSLPGLGSPRLSRMGSFSSRPSPLGPFSPRGSLVEPASPTAFLGLGTGQLKTGGSPP